MRFTYESASDISMSWDVAIEAFGCYRWLNIAPYKIGDIVYTIAFLRRLGGDYIAFLRRLGGDYKAACLSTKDNPQKTMNISCNDHNIRFLGVSDWGLTGL